MNKKGMNLQTAIAAEVRVCLAKMVTDKIIEVSETKNEYHLPPTAVSLAEWNDYALAAHLVNTEGNVSAAARLLGINRKVYQRKIKAMFRKRLVLKEV